MGSRITGTALDGWAAGAVAGMVGGVVASWAMVRFQRDVWPAPAGDGGESSSARLARRLAAPFATERLTDAQASAAGEAIHYALGAGLGIAYGAAAAVRPAIARGAGAPLGVATELVFDQGLVPALGVGNPFWRCPVEWHVRGLAAHLLFGAVTEGTRRALVAILRSGPPSARR